MILFLVRPAYQVKKSSKWIIWARGGGHMGRDDRPRSHWDTFLPQGQTLTADYYINNILEKEVKPVLHRKNVNEATDKRKLFSSNRHMTFVQDGVPAHPAKATQAWCKKKKTAKFYGENHEGSEKTAQTSLEENPALHAT